MSDVALWTGVALFGGAAAVVRVAVADRLGPVRGTLAVNLFGAALLGLLVGTGADGDLLLLAGGGVLGALTTFSTWMGEVVDRAAPRLLAGAFAAGLGAAALGYAVGTVL